MTRIDRQVAILFVHLLAYTPLTYIWSVLITPACACKSRRAEKKLAKLLEMTVSKAKKELMRENVKHQVVEGWVKEEKKSSEFKENFFYRTAKAVAKR